MGKQEDILPGYRSVLRGLDADLTWSDPQETQQGPVRHAPDGPHILLDAGLILIVTAISPTPATFLAGDRSTREYVLVALYSR